jgi:hypothetical protein
MLHRFRWTSDAHILRQSLALHEAQYAVALEHGAASWADLKQRVQGRPAASRVVPTLETVIEYYLREDVASALWELSQRRALRFFYKSSVDLRTTRRTPASIVLHCEPTLESFRARIERAARRGAPGREGFLPFFGMGFAANAPGQPQAPVGWDLRFETDRTLEESFRAVLPMLALLTHFGVTVLAKFSGRRSLHVVIPAEAFPAEMRHRPEHAVWMQRREQLGTFLCRFAPPEGKTHALVGRDMVLTAPYSVHRYFGRVSLPLTLSRALEFDDPDEASIESFAGVTWRASQLDSDSDGMGELLEVAQRAERDPALVLSVAREVFGEPIWGQLARRNITDRTRRPVAASIMAGVVGICGLQPDASELDRERLDHALVLIDSPQVKDAKLVRMIGSRGFNPYQGRGPREAVTHALAAWVRGGLDEGARYLMRLADDETSYRWPVAFAVRMLSLLPETPERHLEVVRSHWRRQRLAEIRPRHLMLAVALAELAATSPDALDELSIAPELAAARSWVIGAGAWQFERRPDVMLASLCLAFGIDRVTSWVDGLTAEPPDPIAVGLLGRLCQDRSAKFSLRKLAPALGLAPAPPIPCTTP